jgi:hypothetical protein
MAPIVEQQYDELESLVGMDALQQVYDVLDTLLQRLQATGAMPDAGTSSDTEA